MMHQDKVPTNSQEIGESKQTTGPTNNHTDVVNESGNIPHLKSQKFLFNSKNDDFTSKFWLEKIVEWKIKNDIELKESEKMINNLKEFIEKQRKYLFEQEMQCENISQEYANEVKQKEGLDEKAKSTLNISNVLQDHYQKVNLTFQSFIKIKQDISKNISTIKENYEQLKHKFDALHKRLCEEIYTYKEKCSFQNELHMMKKREYKQLLAPFEEKLKYYEGEIMKMKDVNNKLESDLVLNSNHIQQLTEITNQITAELTENIIHLEPISSEAINMKNIVAQEVDVLKNKISEFGKLQETYTNSQDKRNEADQISASPKRLFSVLTSTPKRMCFDDWSDVTDDSCMDLNLFKADNVKIVPRSENKLNSQLYKKGENADNTSKFPGDINNEVTGSTIVPTLGKEPARNAKAFKNTKSPSEQNIFSSFLK